MSRTAYGYYGHGRGYSPGPAEQPAGTEASTSSDAGKQAWELLLLPLLETLYVPLPPHFEEHLLASPALAGYRILLAHPERCPSFPPGALLN